MNQFVLEEKNRYNQLQKQFTLNNQPLHATNILHYAALEHPERMAIIFNDKPISYIQLYTMAVAYAETLQSHGIKTGDKILICFENSPAFYVAYYATWHLNAIVVPVNTFLSEYELSHIITDAQPRCIITSQDRIENFKKNGAMDILLEILPLELPIPEQCITVKKEIKIRDENVMVALLYTSGTTGLPKGVMLSSKNITTNILQALIRLPIEKNHRVFAALPLFHVFAQNTCVWTAFCASATIILVPKISRHAILADLKHKPTVFLGVPALYGLLCMLKTAPLESVEYFVSGGDALPDKIRTYFSLIYHRKICNGYGLTETSPVIAFDLDDYISESGCLGVPLYNIACSIRDAEGNQVPDGQIGQLWIKSETVMLGYYNAPEQTAKVIQNGWFDTGDRVFINSSGKLVIAGREKDLIIHKGFNIYPQEIENVLLSHQLVIRAAVIGQKDEDETEFPVAFVQISTEKEDLEKELLALCKQRLASYKIPRKFFWQRENLPLTATNKVDKKVLRQKNWK